MNDWEEKNNKIQRLFTFSNFGDALRFVNKVGELAEKMQHHPDIILQNYKEVVVISTTHDSGGITEKDYELAKTINALLYENF